MLTAPQHFGTRNPRRSRALDLLHETEHVLRLGFHPDGRRWAGTMSDASRLSELREWVRFHLRTDPALA